jgi:hypothetical protein
MFINFVPLKQSICEVELDLFKTQTCLLHQFLMVWKSLSFFPKSIFQGLFLNVPGFRTNLPGIFDFPGFLVRKYPRNMENIFKEPFFNFKKLPVDNSPSDISTTQEVYVFKPKRFRKCYIYTRYVVELAIDHRTGAYI